MEHKRPQTVTAIFRRKRSWRYWATWCQAALQGHEITAAWCWHESKHTDPWKSGEPRHKPMPTWPIDTGQERRTQTVGVERSVQGMGLEQLDGNMQRNGARSSSYTRHRDELKMGCRPNCAVQNHETPGGEHGSKISDIPLSNIFPGRSPQARETREWVNKWTHQGETLVHSSGNHQQVAGTTFRVGEDVHQWCIWSGINVQHVQRTNTTQHQK